MSKLTEVVFTNIPDLVAGEFKPAVGSNRGWTAIPYEAGRHSGVGLFTCSVAPFQELAFDLKLTGGYMLYAGIGRSQIRFRVDGMKGYFQLFSEHGAPGPMDVELGWFDMTGRRLYASRVDPPEATRYVSNFGPSLFYIRAVPCPKPAFNRNMIATNDGWSFYALRGFRSVADIAAMFEPLEQSDVFRVLYGPGNGDATMNPFTRAGSPLTESMDWGYRDCDIRAQEAMRTLRTMGVNPVQEAVRACRRAKLEVHFYLRVEGYYGAFPYLGVLDSKSFLAHPEWRCRDEHGDEIHMASWAHPGFQEHMLRYIDELLEYEPEGICLAFNRGLPMMICEQAVLDEFKRRHGRSARLPEEGDAPEMIQVRQEILAAFIRRLHQRLAQRGKVLSCMVNPWTEAIERDGLGLRAMAMEGLFESICVGGACHTSDYWTSIQASGKSRIYPIANVWDSKCDPQAFARSMLQNVHDAGFPGSFTWDIETIFENPYNWFLHRRAGSADFLRGIASGTIPMPAIQACSRVNGVKISRYNPNVGF